MISLPMPEGGAEHDVVFTREHRCDQARALKKAVGDDELDLLVFPVGVCGWEIPAGIAFPVTALEPCGACGRTLTAMFEWVAPKLWTP